MRLCSIASGSSGNCIYVGNGFTHLLVDAGISAKRIEEGLTQLGVLPRQLSGILITHEHSDHIQGLKVFLKKYQIPLYSTRKTLESLLRGKNALECDYHQLYQIQYEEDFKIGDITIHPFPISHDASQPVSYSFSCQNQKIGMATDLGVYNEHTIRALNDSGILYLEANHDERVLMVGKYPYALKQRILGEYGHLSNDTAAELISKLLHKDLKCIILGHLSKENNYPELAFETVRQMVVSNWNFENEIPEIIVANRDSISKAVQIP